MEMETRTENGMNLKEGQTEIRYHCLKIKFICHPRKEEIDKLPIILFFDNPAHEDFSISNDFLNFKKNRWKNIYIPTHAYEFVLKNLKEYVKSGNIELREDGFVTKRQMIDEATARKTNVAILMNGLIVAVFTKLLDLFFGK